MKKIVVAGHVSLDITPEFHNQPVTQVSELFRPGKLIEVGAATLHTGGAVCNTGLALHKLGADVVLLAKIGADEFGALVKKEIAESGCREKIKVVQGEATSYTLVLSPKGLDRIFLHNSGCNHTLTYEDIDFDEVANADHFHFGYPPLLHEFYKNDGENLVKLYKKVKELGVTTSLDMVMVDKDSEAGKCDWKKILTNVLPYVDFFVPSIEELAYFIDPPRFAEWMEKNGDKDITTELSLSKDIKPLAEQVMQMGANVVLLKCGTAGMYLKTASDKVMKSAYPKLNGWSNIDHFENSYKPDRLCCATGAGDTSIAAFLKAMLDGCTPHESLQYAAATGACCVSTWDSISGLKPFEELREKIEKGWEKQQFVQP